MGLDTMDGVKRRAVQEFLNRLAYHFPTPRQVGRLIHILPIPWRILPLTVNPEKLRIINEYCVVFGYLKGVKERRLSFAAEEIL